MLFAAFDAIIPTVISMIYTKLTNKAIKIAYQAHHGQTDKSGIPYIFHPYHLAEQMDDEYSVCVALLHDTVEDTDITLQQLAEEFPAEIVEAVRLMTHAPEEPYLSYVARIKTNPLAKKVKLADLRHNTDQTRMENADVAMLTRYQKKYQRAIEILEENEK